MRVTYKANTRIFERGKAAQHPRLPYLKIHDSHVVANVDLLAVGAVQTPEGERREYIDIRLWTVAK